MKIAFLTPEYPHHKTGNYGGIGTSIKNLSKGLIEHGNKVIIIIYGQKEDAIFEEDGITFHQVKNVKIKGLSWYFTRKKIQKIINDLYDSDQVDLIEAPDWTGITSFIKVKCPIVIRQNGSDTYFCHLDGRKVKFINKFHEKYALKSADSVISVSKFTGQLTNRLFNLNLNFTVIPNCIDNSFFVANSVAGDQHTLLYFGSLIRKKGLLELPHIFNKVVERNPNAKLIIVGRDVPDIITGNNSTWEMAQELFSKEALRNVDYIGVVAHNSIKQYIQNATVCLFPSFAEALPLAWLEAMAVGKAIVASNVGWAKEMIDDGTDGFLVHPTDHKLYAERIDTLLLDSDLRHVFGEKAIEKINSTFSASTLIAKNMNYYQTIINEKI